MYFVVLVKNLIFAALTLYQSNSRPGIAYVFYVYTMYILCFSPFRFIIHIHQCNSLTATTILCILEKGYIVNHNYVN